MLEHGHVGDRLDQIIAGAVAQRLHHIVHDAGTGDHDDGHIDGVMVERSEQLETIAAARQLEIEQHHIRLPALEQLEAAVAVAGLVDDIAQFPQIGCHAVAHRGIVIDDQQPVALAFHDHGCVARPRASGDMFMRLFTDGHARRNARASGRNGQRIDRLHGDMHGEQRARKARLHAWEQWPWG